MNNGSKKQRLDVAYGKERGWIGANRDVGFAPISVKLERFGALLTSNAPEKLRELKLSMVIILYLTAQLIR